MSGSMRLKADETGHKGSRGVEAQNEIVRNAFETKVYNPLVLPGGSRVELDEVVRMR